MSPGKELMMQQYVCFASFIPSTVATAGLVGAKFGLNLHCGPEIRVEIFKSSNRGPEPQDSSFGL